MTRTSARRHAAIVAAISVALSALGLALVLGVPFLPELASREARAVDQAFLVLLATAVPVFVLVEVVVVYSVLRFRQGAGGEDGPPIEGNRGLETAWVVVTLVMVLGLAAVGWAGLNEIRHAASGNPDLRVRVIAFQFGWRFEYPDLGLTSNELRLPKDRAVRFELASRDVIHSFWVPPFRVKQDAVPGRSLSVTITPTETGRWEVLCAELCGVGHTFMRAPVEVMSAAAFDAWVAEKKVAAR